MSNNEALIILCKEENETTVEERQEAVDVLQELINKYENPICPALNRGNYYCYGCGHWVDKLFKHCPHCGQRLKR